MEEEISTIFRQEVTFKRNDAQLWSRGWLGLPPRLLAGLPKHTWLSQSQERQEAAASSSASLPTWPLCCPPQTLQLFPQHLGQRADEVTFPPITHLTLLSSIMGSCFSGISSSLHPARRPELEYLVPNKWDPTCQMPLNSYLNPTYDISKKDLASQKSIRWGPRQILGLRPTMSACTQAEHFSDPQWTEHMPSPLYPKTWTKNMFLRKVSFWISSFTSTPLLSLPTLRKITYDMDAVIFFIFQKSLLSL